MFNIQVEFTDILNRIPQDMIDSMRQEYEETQPQSYRYEADYKVSNPYTGSNSEFKVPVPIQFYSSNNNTPINIPPAKVMPKWGRTIISPTPRSSPQQQYSKKSDIREAYFEHTSEEDVQDVYTQAFNEKGVKI